MPSKHPFMVLLNFIVYDDFERNSRPPKTRKMPNLIEHVQFVCETITCLAVVSFYCLLTDVFW